MSTPMIMTATEARKNFFTLLDQVESGKEAIIVKRDSKTRFAIRMLPEKKTAELPKILTGFSRIGLKTDSWKEMKRVITQPQ